ncbi:MAG: FabA-like domain protein [Mucilaginibacter sp.]|nr:FabA-like domain protein [Mucilaginibacter sp.]
MGPATDIFAITKIEHQNNSVHAALDVNKDSEIFKGHFPGQPVVPGACMLQVVKDVLETALNIQLQLKKAGHLKFVSMIDPRVAREVQMEISYKLGEEEIAITASLACDGVVCFKLQGNFIKL